MGILAKMQPVPPKRYKCRSTGARQLTLRCSNKIPTRMLNDVKRVSFNFTHLKLKFERRDSVDRFATLIAACLLTSTTAANLAAQGKVQIALEGCPQLLRDP